MRVDDPKQPHQRGETRGRARATRWAGRHYQALLNDTPDPIVVTDTTGRLELVNKQACALFGYTQDELIGQPIEILLAESVRASEQARRNGYMAAGRPLMAPWPRLTCRRKDGSEFPGEFSLNATTTPNGVFVLSAIRDLTSRVEVEDALRASDERFRRIIDAAREGIWMIDANGLTTFVNPHMASLLGYGVDEMVGRPMVAFADEVGQRCLTDYLDQRRRGVSANNELRLERKDGQALWVLLATTPIQGGAGQYQGALVMVTDLTEQKRMQASLQIADRMVSVGTLAAGVAHEINNPLAALIGNLDLMADEMAQDAARRAGAAPREGGHDGDQFRLPTSEVAQFLDDARDAAEKVRQIVRDVKLFSRPEEDRRTAVDVRRVLESALRLAWNEVRHRARLVKDYQAVPQVDANEGRLGQVFLNLIINAAQAIPEGHAEENEIRIVSRLASDGRVVIEVRDSGPGISPEILVRIFDPFFTTKPSGVGTGLGLAICQRIIGEQGGDIWVKTTVGQGSVFYVALPVYAARPASQPDSTSATHLAPPPRARILVIDDEPLVRAMLERALSTDHQVTTESHAEQALARFRAGERYDVILCDVMMPQMTGMDLHEALRVLAPDQATRIIFVTAGAFTGCTREFLQNTPNRTLEKPFEIGRLRSLVIECASAPILAKAPPWPRR